MTINDDKNELRNQLTEHKCDYKMINPNLLSCYTALHPSSISKICTVLFNYLLSTKNYNKDVKNFNIDEEKRIFTNIYISPEDILKNCHPVQYCLEKTEVTTGDIGNFLKKLNEIDEMNIFYYWRYEACSCSSCYAYMFIMERDIGCWKFFNPKACVTPKTIHKIIQSAEYMIQSMKNILDERKIKYNDGDVELSFEKFFDSMIVKMNPSVIRKFPNIISNKLDEYKKILNTILPYEGLEIDEKFLDRIPPVVRSQVIEAKIMDDTIFKKLEDELVPKERLEKTKKEKREKPPKELKDVKITANTENYKALDPFKCCNDFMKYYQIIAKHYNPQIELYNYNDERKYATETLDILILNYKMNNKEFLRNWIKYYVTNYLKGDNAKNKDKTSVKAFNTSFNSYIGKSLS